MDDATGSVNGGRITPESPQAPREVLSRAAFSARTITSSASTIPRFGSWARTPFGLIDLILGMEALQEN